MASTSTAVLFLSLLGVALGRGIQDSTIMEIVDGHTVDIENRPYMAAIAEVIEWPNTYRVLCGGTIVHSQFILTAAQCLVGDIKDMVVIVGSTTLLSGASRQVYEVDEVFPHEKYDGTDFGYDIGLIKLVHVVIESSSVERVNLADENVATPTNLVGNITGWGSVVKSDRYPLSAKLRELEMSVRNSVDCEQHFDTFSADKEICLWKIHSGPCIGDAGDPFTANNRQIGIISRGATCGILPTTVVKVAPHLEWIDNTIYRNA